MDGSSRTGFGWRVVKRTVVMEKRIAVWIVSISLAGSCGAVGQSERRAQRVVQGIQSGAADTVLLNAAGPKGIEEQTLPDAPSAVIAERGERGISLSESGMEAIHAAPPLNRAVVYEARPAEKDAEAEAFLQKFLEPSPHKPGSRYQASSSDSLLGRATDAASRIFVTRDETGRRKVNASYFVAVLTTVAAHRAERPYWARSNSAPLGDFGSTVGNDAGMNLLHEFGPGLRQAVTEHMPGFVLRIEEHMVRGRQPSPAAPAR